MEEESIESGVDSIVTLNNPKANMSPREAAQALSQHRWKRDAAPEVARSSEALDRAAEPESSTEEVQDAAPPEEATGEVSGDEPEATVTTDPVSEPPIELPRSWAKDKADVWAKLDRETQEYLRDHDSKASTEVRRSQNEAAEQRKAFEAERQQLEQARKQYEEAAYFAIQQATQSGDFSDIKTMADVERLAREDWPRYALWDAQQKKVAAYQQELKASQDRQAQEYKAQWDKFVDQETKAFLESAPELSTSEKQNKFASDVRDYYKTIGFTSDEITKLIGGQASVSPHDRRLLTMARDAIAYRQAKSAIPKAQAKPVPQVQRPGTAPQRAPDRDVRMRALEKRVTETGNWKDAAELLIARRSR